MRSTVLKACGIILKNFGVKSIYCVEPKIDLQRGLHKNSEEPASPISVKYKKQK